MCVGEVGEDGLMGKLAGIRIWIHWLSSRWPLPNSSL